MSSFKTIDMIGDLAGKVVLVRVDFNVPVSDQKVTDDTRLRAAIPTVKALSEAGAKVVLLSHFGRPQGTVKSKFSLYQVKSAFAKIFDKDISFASNCIGPVAQTAIKNLPDQGVVLFENTRFHPGEESNDLNFAQELASLGDIFVNDAFSVSHRAAASNEGITKFLPAFAGKSMRKELEALQLALATPIRPVFAIVGGSKVSTKIELLNNLVTKVDLLAVGGGMANTFLSAKGHYFGNSLVEKSLHQTALEIIKNAEQEKCQLLLPFDVTVSEKLDSGCPNYDKDVEDIKENEMALDIGPGTVAKWKRSLSMSKTVIWNGPVGAFETNPFDRGTTNLANFVAKLAKEGKITAVAGGGDTIAALNLANVVQDFTHVSTAGGAFLQWLEGKPLPGVTALMTNQKLSSQQLYNS